MGSFKQHVEWGKSLLIILLMVLLMLSLISDTLSGNIIGLFITDKGTVLTVVIAGFFFVLGNVFPDIDHDSSRISNDLALLFPFMKLSLWQRHTVHWGHWHSIFAAVFLSELLIIGLLLLTGSLGSVIIGISFGIGYINHLACDQFYHSIKGKKWSRKALKLW